jgi:ESX secretion system ATPase EccB
MQSRKDQVQAYFFVVGRLVAALTHGKPDILEQPNRRFSTGTVIGLLLAGLLVAIFGIYGLFVPGGNKAWRQPGTIIVEKETGARYLFLDNQLRPVLNFSSARLATGEDAKVISVSRNSLSQVAVGAPIGIPGAPDSLPQPDRLHTGPWTVCAQPQGDSTSRTSAATILLLNPPGGPGLPDDQGILVTTPDTAVYLLWKGTRYHITDPVALEALGYAGTKRLQVPASWLNSIPAGRDIAVPQINGIGKSGPKINGQPSVIGKIYEIRNPALNSDELYVMRPEGLVRLSRTTAAMLLAAPASRGAYSDASVEPVAVGPGALVGVPIFRETDLSTAYPPIPPTLVASEGDRLPCVRFGPSRGAGGMTKELMLLPPDAAKAAVPTGTVGTTADRVSIDAGAGVLAQSLPAPGAAPTTEYLITDIGVKYPLVNPSVAAVLGYGQVPAVNVPRELLELLPTGPVLNPGVARNSQFPK